MPFAEIKFFKSEIIFEKMKEEISLLLNLENFKILNLTNYPTTINEEKNWREISQQEFLGVSNGSNSLLSMNYRVFFIFFFLFTNNIFFNFFYLIYSKN